MTTATTPRMTFSNKKNRLAWVKNQLKTSPSWAIKALKSIHSNQTAAEQIQHSTTDLNGVGFTGFDAPILTSFAQQVLRWEAIPESSRQFSVPLSIKQLNCLHKMIAKYAQQLIDMHKESFDNLYPIV